MPIKLKLDVNKHNIEGNFELRFKRERLDIKNVLIELSQGKKLVDLFPTSVASSLYKQFIERGLIDTNQKLQIAGYEYIQSPFIFDTEKSIYAVDYLDIDLFGMKKNLMVNVTRRLKNVDLPLTNVDLNNFVANNELKINDEKIYFDSISNNVGNKVYLGSTTSSTITFIVDEKKYDAGYGEKYTGNLQPTIEEYVKGIVEQKTSDFALTSDLSSVIIKNLGVFTDEDLLNCELSSCYVDNISITKMPLIIDDISLARKYAYLCIYKRINSGSYLSYDEMNEIFENEIFPKNIFTEEVKKDLANFSYSDTGFKRYLADYQYNDLSYKLRVMETLLDYKADNKKIAYAKSYDDVANYLTEMVSPNDVNKLYLVLGYAFAKTIKNRIVDCVKAIQRIYPNICIVSKNNGSSQRLDDSIPIELSNLNVDLKTNIEIGSLFHDRYMVFELKDGTSKVLLTTSEIGQFFNIDTNEPTGSIVPISNDEVIKNNKSLITMVKEAK